MNKLPTRHPATVFDPQCGLGALLNCSNGYPVKYGIELDDSQEPGRRPNHPCQLHAVFEAISDVAPTLRFVVGNANVPFGRHWKMKNGQTIDSTLATWRFLTTHANCGFLIGNATAIEKLLIHESTDKIDVFFYERRQYWRGRRPELNRGPVLATYWPGRRYWQIRLGFYAARGTICHLDSAPQHHGGREVEPAQLQYISGPCRLLENLFVPTHPATSKLKLNTRIRSAGFTALNGCHPLGLTTEKETRDLMKELVNCGLYSLQPEAEAAIERITLSAGECYGLSDHAGYALRMLRVCG